MAAMRAWSPMVMPPRAIANRLELTKTPPADLQQIQRRAAERRRNGTALTEILAQQLTKQGVIFLGKRQRVVQPEQQLRRALPVGTVRDGTQIDPNFFTFHSMTLLSPFSIKFSVPSMLPP